MALTAECPACKDGRHERCIGQPLSEEQAPLPGMWRDCSCANRDHLTVNQWIDRQAVIRAGEAAATSDPEQVAGFPEWDEEMVQPGLLAHPVLPYAGTSGWSGSDTSEERARTEDSDGTTSERQAKVLSILQRRNLLGATVSEVRDMTGLHHGKVSAALSVLHKEGLIARLTERRERCKVYVLLDNVDGRETEPHGRKVPPARKAAEDRVRAFLDGRATGKGLDPEHIIGFNLTALTVSDLRILIGDEQ